MTDTLVAILTFGGSNFLFRLFGFTGSQADTPIDLATIGGFSFPQNALTGCNWNKDGDACFVGTVPGGVAYKLVGFSSTKKDELRFLVTSLGSNAITCDGDDPIANVGAAVDGSGTLYQLTGWTTTVRRSTGLEVNGVEWDGNDLRVARATSASRAFLRKYRGFSSTVEREFEVSTSFDHAAVGISYDGLDTIFSGNEFEKLYKVVAFSSTPKGSSVDLSAFGDSVNDLSHMSYAERTSQKTPVGSPGTYWSGDQDQSTYHGSLYHSVGFTSTLDGPVRLAVTDTPNDLTFDGTNIYWCGKKEGNEPFLRKCSGFSSTPIQDIPLSSLSATENNPQGMSWDGVNMLWAGSGVTDTLYRQVGFTTTPSASAACAAGHHEPNGVSWIGTHTIWSSAQSGKIIRSPGFTATATETLDVFDPTRLRGVSHTGADTIWADKTSVGGRAALVKQVGFTTTVKNIVDVESIDLDPSGIEHGDLLERIGPGFAVVIRPRVGRRKVRRRNRPVIRFGRKTLPGVAPAAGPRPLQSLIGRRVRKPRNRKTRQPVPLNRPMHTSVAPAPAPPQLGDILWMHGDGASYAEIGVDIGSTGVLRSSFDISAIALNPRGLSYDGNDAYFTASVLSGGVETNPRIHRTLGWSSTIRATLFLSLGSGPRGVCWDGRDILWADEQTRAHYKLDGFTSTVKDTKVLEGISTDLGGLTWTGGDCLWVGGNNSMNEGLIYRRSGFGGPIVDSVSSAHLGGTIEVPAVDVTWDQSNLITSGGMEVGDAGGVSRRVGWSSTHDALIRRTGSLASCCVADVRYRLGGPNPIRRMLVVPRTKRRTFRPVARLPRPQVHVNPPVPPVAFSPATLRRPFRRVKHRIHTRRMVRIGAPLIDIRRHYFAGRGKYRVFNTAAYIFYRSNTGPPTETDALYESSATLPATPAATFADGTWWISVAYFNGVVKSGFLPLGPNGETFVRLDIVGGAVAGSPPQAPGDWRLEVRAGGVIRVVGFYLQLGANRATHWAITYTTNGSTPGTPPAVSPTVTVLMPTAGLAILSYDLPAQANGTTVKVRVQTKRGTAYSENSVVKTAIADATGPSAVATAQRWPGRLPENL